LFSHFYQSANITKLLRFVNQQSILFLNPFQIGYYQVRIFIQVVAKETFY